MKEYNFLHYKNVREQLNRFKLFGYGLQTCYITKDNQLFWCLNLELPTAVYKVFRCKSEPFDYYR